MTKYILITILSLFLFIGIASAQSFGVSYFDSTAINGTNQAYGTATLPGYGTSTATASNNGFGISSVQGSVSITTKDGYKGSIVRSSAKASSTSKPTK